METDSAFINYANAVGGGLIEGARSFLPRFVVEMWLRDGVFDKICILARQCSLLIHCLLLAHCLLIAHGLACMHDGQNKERKKDQHAKEIQSPSTPPRTGRNARYLPLP